MIKSPLFWITITVVITFMVMAITKAYDKYVDNKDDKSIIQGRYILFIIACALLSYIMGFIVGGLLVLIQRLVG